MTTTADHDDIYRRIRALLEATSYTQQRIAEVAGLSIKSVQNAAEGKRFAEGGKVEQRLLKALDEIEQASPVGGLDYAARVEALEARFDQIDERLDSLERLIREVHDEI